MAVVPRFRKTVHAILFTVVASVTETSTAQYRLRDVDTQKFTNAVISLMAYSAIPDLASSSLSINSAQSGNPAISMSQLGGGATVSTSTPIYLEGAAAYSRYDPVFIASDGAQTRSIAAKWNSVTLQAGIGWDFPMAEDLNLRPIFNLAYGGMTSDISVASAVVGARNDIEFLDGGVMEVAGLGGALMLDYESAETARDIDLELRYSYIHLQSIKGNSAVTGYSDSSTASLYYRYRAPVDDWKVLKNPFRYVLEGSYSYYLGDQAGVLGFDSLASLGVGMEVDSSAYQVWVTRTRLVGRYMFGPNVRGYSIGLACSF